MPDLSLSVNGRMQTVDVDPEMPLLWALRDNLGLVGTKFGCGGGFCGACTVHVDGVATRSCTLPVGKVAGRAIITIEGLAAAPALHPVQRAWTELDVAQCGYCQAGQIMTRRGAPHAHAESHRRADRERHERESVPMRHLHAHPRCGPPRRRALDRNRVGR